MKRIGRFVSVLFGWSVLFCGVLAAENMRFYVRPTGNDSNDGKSWLTSLKTIQCAFNRAAEYDDGKSVCEVWVAVGRYETVDLISPKNLVLMGGFKGSESYPSERGKRDRSIFDARKKGRIFADGQIADNARIKFNAIHFANGYTEYSGGVIDDGSSISLSFFNCVFSENSAKNFGGALMLTGGGCSSLFENCIFYRNEASIGGALSLFNGKVNFKNCTFFENNSYWHSGVFDCSYGYAIFENCTFVCNASNGGGGVAAILSPEYYLNCTFAGNCSDSSNDLEVYIYTEENGITRWGTAYVYNCIFSEKCPKSNLLSGRKQNMFSRKAVSCLLNPKAKDKGKFFIENSIIGRNVEYSNKRGNRSNMYRDPKLLPLDFYGDALVPTMPVAAGSVALKKGITQSKLPVDVVLPEVDALGKPRDINKPCTLGAVEGAYVPIRIKK